MNGDGLRGVVGVYDADGTIVGELTYWVGARLGRAHCALCDISHGMFRARAEWNRLLGLARVPITTWHRNDAPPEILAATAGRLAAVVAVTDDGVVSLLGPEELEAIDGDVATFARRIDEAVIALGHAPLFPASDAATDGSMRP